MNNNKIKIIITVFLLLNFKVEAYQDFKCSLQCTGKTCGKNIESLENCARTCPPIEYQQCWVNGIEALTGNTSLEPSKRMALLGLLKRNLKSSIGQAAPMQAVHKEKRFEEQKSRQLRHENLLRMIEDTH